MLALSLIMQDFLRANIAPVMFVAMIIFLLLGYPVAFSLAACGIFLVSLEFPWDYYNPRFSKPCRIVSGA